MIGCRSIQPTPEPFPIHGVDQLTTDYAFYRDLMWSPSGEWIAAARCPIQQAEPNCLGNEVAVLVDPDRSGAEPIDFEPLSANLVNGYPVAWSGTDERLLLYVEVSPTSDPAPVSERESYYVAYSPSTRTFEEIHSEPDTVFAWDAAEESLLITRDSEGRLSFGWHRYATGEFDELSVYDESEKLGGPHVLSPDLSALLRGDSPLPTTCRAIDRADMRAFNGFEPFLTMACYPAWSANGLKIAYMVKDDSQSEPNRLLIANSDGSASSAIFGEQLVAFLAYPTWSPDGSHIAFTKGGLENANAVYVAEVPSELRP